MKRCQICRKSFHPEELLPLELLRPDVLSAMHYDAPDLNPKGWVCLSDVAKYRAKQTESMMMKEHGELTREDRAVVKSIAERSLMSYQMLESMDQDTRTWGEKMSDRIAKWGGSWSFILCLMFFLLSWLGINSYLLIHAFDPYPYIFLNLILSLLASVQAPIILMSQNRQADKDRIANIKDYQINLKSEIEIRSLHSKIDHLTQHIWLLTRATDYQKNERK